MFRGVSRDIVEKDEVIFVSLHPLSLSHSRDTIEFLLCVGPDKFEFERLAVLMGKFVGHGVVLEDLIDTVGAHCSVRCPFASEQGNKPIAHIFNDVFSRKLLAALFF